MAYVFDPTTNTLIDDEDKSLGNKLALNQDEFLKLLEIPGVFRASEAPQPPPRPDVQEIDAINRFVRDNPVNKAEGGAIGGGIITGEDYGDRTGFEKIRLSKSEARQLKNTRPDLFNKIMELADKKTLGPTEIRRDPAVLKLTFAFSTFSSFSS